MAAGTPTAIESTRDEPRAVAAPVERQRAAARSISPIAVAIWLICAVGLWLFILLARVPIEAGWRAGRSMRVLDIWILYAREVLQVAGPLVTPAMMTALVVLVLGGALVGLWLAMSVGNDQQTPDTD